MVGVSRRDENQESIVEALLSVKTLDSVLRISTSIDSVVSTQRSPAEQFQIEKSRTNDPEILRSLENLQSQLSRKLYRQFIGDAVSYLKLKPTDTNKNELDSNDLWMQRVEFCLFVIAPAQTEFGSMIFEEVIQPLISLGAGLDAAKFGEIWIPSIRADRDALLLLRSLQAYNILTGDYIQECTQIVEELLHPIFDEFSGLPSFVRSAFYRVCFNLYLKLGRVDDIYKYGMLYLACTPVADLSKEEQIKLAYNLCLAAIKSRRGYSFVELRQQIVLSSISDPTAGQLPEESWIVRLVEIIDSGDRKTFKDFMHQNPDRVQLAGLNDDADFVWKKVQMFALLSLACNRQADEKLLTFDRIATHCQIEKNEVETLVMEAMCHGLVQGSLDGIEEKVAITKIQPRLLDPDSIRALAERFTSWSRASVQMSKALIHMTDASQVV